MLADLKQDANLFFLFGTWLPIVRDRWSVNCSGMSSEGFNLGSFPILNLHDMYIPTNTLSGPFQAALLKAVVIAVESSLARLDVDRKQSLD